MKRLAHTFTSRAAFGAALGLAIGVAITAELRWLGMDWLTGAVIAAPVTVAATADFIFPRPKRLRISLKRPAEELCTRCGYSLTGNVSGICPECGTPVRP